MISLKAPIPRSGSVKDFFVPHAGNNHAPHMLHPTRAILYGGVFVAVKAIVIVAILGLPLQAYLLPDVLAEQASTLDVLINDLRTEQSLPTLASSEGLARSAQLKASDMVTYSYFSHVGPDKRDFQYFLQQASYPYRIAGENLAMGFVSAEDVMAAWKKSPLHYQNLIDPNFVEMGLGLDSGTYKGKETVFIANHFGQPISYVPGLVTTESVSTVKPVSERVVDPRNVLGEREVATPAASETTTYDKTSSYVTWRDDGSETTLTARAAVSGEVTAVVVTVDGHEIVLHPLEETDGLYTGSITLAQPIDDFFKVVIDPSISITRVGGVTTIDSIPWYEIKVVSQTPSARYLSAHNLLGGIFGPLFTAERVIYILGIVFFSLALLINILIEVKTQRPHVIIPTGLILILLTVLLTI